ncbi:hypothetical protein EMIHUDRAFT_235273 [Emiliania huxleyi CCMP1516]|uniref:U-box domain-containing protein n=2 Tax=Emiliania huxleyi TaxID=2903 RepID=A0A0D3JX31_EMIH1|nr:hypothetical protein EMIHUDRAFT_235273 [Emiliania huxleyi CCMP1516]EOD28066.1 hypothetical protein EMIHUDRAFT_235273 [Emiliania huxleyi CCMP1516]|eukprot:XP_005780495.1 hypothetical protein EMIHUDRAFT_235273 [Emiliania huxleyi CCMP1516]
MSDPVMAADGHAYERTAIERWLASKSTSPMTGGELEHSILVPNHMLRRMIRDWQGAQKAATSLFSSESHRDTRHTVSRTPIALKRKLIDGDTGSSALGSAEASDDVRCRQTAEKGDGSAGGDGHYVSSSCCGPRRRRAESAIDELRAAGVPVVAVETVAGAPYAHEFAFPPPPAGHGLAPELLARCDAVVRLPCRGPTDSLHGQPRANLLSPWTISGRLGRKNSLNVAVALGMCAHEAARQWAVGGKEAAGDAVGK